MFVTAEDFGEQPYKLSFPKLEPNEFESFVNDREEENLREVFGSLFYDSFIKGLNDAGNLVLFDGANHDVDYQCVYVVDGVADVYKCIVATTNKELPTDDAHWEKQAVNRWIRLQFGDYYVHDTLPYKWYGMNKLVVPMICSLWLRYKFDHVTEKGVVVLSNENSTTISPDNRVRKAWNDYSRLCGGAIKGNYFSWGYQRVGFENTLFGYLYSVAQTFDDVVDNTKFNTFMDYLLSAFDSPKRIGLW